MPNAGTITVLFTDLVDSTGLTSRIGDVEIDGIRRAHFAVLRAAISATGGEEVKNLGDGLMVVYRSAADAIDGAVSMQRAVDRANLSSAEPLAMKVGVSVGDVTQEADDWFGTPVNEAARLCGAAVGGQILISDVVRLLAGSRARHAVRPVGAMQLKGLPEPVAVCEVEWERATTRVRLMVPATLPSSDRPCVGRDDELTRIRESWQQADGRPVLVLVGGEPGVGKTRLAVSAAMQAHDQGVGLLYGRCDEEIAAPFLPWVEIIRQLMAEVDGEVLRDWTGVRAGELTRIVPELARRMADLGAPTTGDPESERFALFDAVVSLLTGAAAAVPLFIILDDFHWADTASALLLRHVLRNTPGSRLTVVATYRDTDLISESVIGQVFGDLRRDGIVDRIRLTGLDSAATGALLIAWAGQPVPEALVKTVHTETDGNPFFIEELIAQLAETDDAATSADHSRLATSLLELGVPEGVANLVRRRASRLTEPARNILAVAAVAGREFDLDVIAAAANAKEDEAVDALDEATAIGLVEQVTPNGRFRFAHSLIRSAIEESLGAARRARLHLRIGEELEAAQPIDVVALAHHYTAATAAGAEKAYEYSTRAARSALDALAYEEAAEHAERGLRALTTAHTKEPHARADLLLLLAEARTDLSEVEAAHSTSVAAADEARRLDDTPRFVNAVFLYGLTGGIAVDPTRTALVQEALARLPDTDSRERALLLSGRAEWAFLSEDDADRADAQSALEMANRLDDPHVIAYSSAVLADLLIGSPNAAGRIELGSQSLHIAETFGIGRAVFNSLQWIPGAFLELGDRAGCEATLADLETRARRLHFESMVVLSGIRALLAMLDGRFEDANTISEQAVGVASGDDPVALIGHVAQQVAMAREIGNFVDLLPQLEMYSTLPGFTAVRTEVGYWYLAQGRADEAGLILDSFKLTNFEAIPRNWARPSALQDLTEITTELHDREAAAQLLPLLDEYRGKLLLVYGIVASRGAADRARGQLLSVLGQHDDALRAFESAAQLEHSVNGRSLLPRTRLAHARALLTRAHGHDQANAQRLLALAADEASMLGMHGLVTQIEALRSQAS
jgi:class 3 adenylate cyclase